MTSNREPKKYDEFIGTKFAFVCYICEIKNHTTSHMPMRMINTVEFM